jgi:hypothetical protein
VAETSGTQDHSSERCNIGFRPRGIVQGNTELSMQRLCCRWGCMGLLQGFLRSTSLPSVPISTFGHFEHLLRACFCQPRWLIKSPYATPRSSTQLNPQRPVLALLILSPQVNEWLLGYRQVTFLSCCTTATISDRPNVVRLHAAQMSLRNNGFSLAAWRMHCFDSDIRGAQ